mgnify:CR=1 FL=1
MQKPLVVAALQRKIITGMSKQEAIDSLIRENWPESLVRVAATEIADTVTSPISNGGTVASLPATTEKVPTIPADPARRQHYARYIGIGSVVVAGLIGFFVWQSSDMPTSTDSKYENLFGPTLSEPISCEKTQPSAEEMALQHRMDELKVQIEKSNAESALDLASDDIEALEAALLERADIDILINEYEENAMKLAKSQAAAVQPELLASVYKKYCSRAPIDTGSIDSSAELSQEFTATSLGTLACNLATSSYPHAQLAGAIHYVGFKLTQADELDKSIAMYECAASKYFDLASMYRMAEVYAYGTDSLQSQAPSSQARYPIPQSLSEAYFWIASLAHAEMVMQTGILDTSTDLGWNIVSLLDGLQNDDSLSDEQLLNEEARAVRLVAERFPEAASHTGVEVYNHSMRTLLPALENAAQQ